MRARATVVFAALASASAAGVARADDRLVLVAPPAALARAARAQLAPYRIDVVIDGAAAPVGADGAHDVAVRFGARAVAWLDGGALVVYDLDDGALVRRPGATLDETGAAALALSLKTVLRDRWRPAAIAGAAAAPPAPPAFELAIIAGMRLRGAEVEPRVTLAIDAAPGSWPLRLGLRGSLGGGVAAHTAVFSGRWSDRALGAIVSVPFEVDRLELTAGVGPSLHATEIRGVLLPSAGEGGAAALNLGVDVEAAAVWRRPPIAVGARAAATWVPWRQRYTVTDVAVFEVSHLEAELGLDVIFTF